MDDSHVGSVVFGMGGGPNGITRPLTALTHRPRREYKAEKSSSSESLSETGPRLRCAGSSPRTTAFLLDLCRSNHQVVVITPRRDYYAGTRSLISSYVHSLSVYLWHSPSRLCMRASFVRSWLCDGCWLLAKVIRARCHTVVCCVVSRASLPVPWSLGRQMWQ